MEQVPNNVRPQEPTRAAGVGGLVQLHLPDPGDTAKAEPKDGQKPLGLLGQLQLVQVGLDAARQLHRDSDEDDEQAAELVDVHEAGVAGLEPVQLAERLVGGEQQHGDVEDLEVERFQRHEPRHWA